MLCLQVDQSFFLSSRIFIQRRNTINITLDATALRFYIDIHAWNYWNILVSSYFQVAWFKDKISQKEETIRKLMESKEEIVELYQKVQRENERLTREESDRSAELRELNLMKERYEQVNIVKMKSGLYYSLEIFVHDIFN